MPAAHLLVFGLADDLTGALEIGARFSATGIPTVVTAQTNAEQATGAAALVLDTETRHAEAAEADGSVRRALSTVAHPGLRLIYKKTDSTLRGNVGAELGALRRAFRDSPLIYLTAYPAMGRTVKDARLLVDGVPVHQSAFGHDALNPIRECHIPGLLAAQHEGPIYSVMPDRLGETLAPGVYVCDAATDADVEVAAAGLAKQPGTILAAGAAPFAEALAARIQVAHTAPPPYPNIDRCLVVNGSRHPRSAAQEEHARGNLPAGWQIFDIGGIRETGLERAACVGRRVRSLVDRAEFDALIVFGGDTAFGILQALGLPELHPYGEILPGVPFSKIVYEGCTLYLLTKAGGFGRIEILSDIRNRIARSSA